MDENKYKYKYKYDIYILYAVENAFQLPWLALRFDNFIPNIYTLRLLKFHNHQAEFKSNSSAFKLRLYDFDLHSIDRVNLNTEPTNSMSMYSYQQKIHKVNINKNKKKLKQMIR